VKRPCEYLAFSYIPGLTQTDAAPMALDNNDPPELARLSQAPAETRVVVAMSGGVDSSVVAANWPRKAMTSWA
jgi:predicted PP-loop superfamily ATPase